jgi:hypothetical protein
MKIYRLILGIFLLGMMIVLIGCETTGNTDTDDEKPWTRREPWEGGVGLPF